LPPVLGDAVQLRQVLLNVLVNAEEAMDAAEAGPHEIRIETSRANDGRVAIDVRDSGVGLAETELERMFNHFVTSKPQGLGMGLAISRSIIQAHQGQIWASRNVGRGLTLHIRLAAAETMPPEEIRSGPNGA
jgi:two-component system sensor kinase FixL